LSADPLPHLVLTDRTTPLSPHLFGQFLERPSWGGETGPEALADSAGRLPAPVVDLIADLAAPSLRFPGGTDVDYMDWTDMIDRAPGRPADAPRPVSRGRDGGPVTNRFGLHEYFDLYPRIGNPDTALVVNLRDALYRVRPLADAARHAAGLVAYVNAPVGAALPASMPDWPALRAANGRPAPWRARWVSLGNETYFFWPPQDATERARLGLETDAAAWSWYRECVLAYADAIHAVDPSIRLILDGLHDPWRPDGANTAANHHRDALLRDPEIRRRIPLLASHYYAPLAFWSCRQNGRDVPLASLSDDDFWAGLLSGPGLFDATGQSAAFGSAYAPYTAIGYRLAITEWNWNAYDTAKPFAGRPFKTHVPAALGAAGFLHGLLRHAGHTELAVQSMLLGTSWDITAIRADPTGKNPPYWLPQGQVAWLYTRHHGDRVVDSQLHHAPAFAHPPQFANWYPEADKLSVIDAVATADAHTLYLHLINRSRTDAQTLSVTLPSANRRPTTWRRLALTGDLLTPAPHAPRPPLSETTGDVPADGPLTLSLPPHSVSVVLLPFSP
jgi:alpha-L-arabinofuranosidase